VVAPPDREAGGCGSHQLGERLEPVLGDLKLRLGAQQGDVGGSRCRVAGDPGRAPRFAAASPARRSGRRRTSLRAAPAAPRARARARPRGRPAQHHPAPTRPRQSRHHLALRVEDRPRGDHHGRAHAPRADDVRKRRAGAVIESPGHSWTGALRRSRSALAKRAPARPNSHDRASSFATVWSAWAEARGLGPIRRGRSLAAGSDPDANTIPSVRVRGWCILSEEDLDRATRRRAPVAARRRGFRPRAVP
jgi:hypothetical protein